MHIPSEDVVDQRERRWVIHKVENGVVAGDLWKRTTAAVQQIVWQQALSRSILGIDIRHMARKLVVTGLTLRNKPSVPAWELAEPLPAAEDSSYSRSAAAVKRCTVSGDNAFST